MKFQRAHRSIIRSIRQVALVRDWAELRGDAPLPELESFEPNQRAGDDADFLLTRVIADADRFQFKCKRAGPRVATAAAHPLVPSLLHECLDPIVVGAASPVWDACVTYKLPVYAIVPWADRDGCPVTLEQLYLPFARQGRETAYMLGSLHAFSTEGRFKLDGLLHNPERKRPLYWAVVIDPSLALAPASRNGATESEDDYALV